MDETVRRREYQYAYNSSEGITPQSIQKGIDSNILAISDADYVTIPVTADQKDPGSWSLEEYEMQIFKLEEEMHLCAKELKFEEAAQVRDQIKELKMYLEKGSFKK